MKNIIMKNVYAVGMHHWCPTQLEIGSIYFLRLEENPRDHNAVAVFALDSYIPGSIRVGRNFIFSKNKLTKRSLKCACHSVD